MATTEGRDFTFGQWHILNRFRLFKDNDFVKTISTPPPPPSAQMAFIKDCVVLFGI